MAALSAQTAAVGVAAALLNFATAAAQAVLVPPDAQSGRGGLPISDCWLEVLEVGRLAWSRRAVRGGS